MNGFIRAEVQMKAEEDLAKIEMGSSRPVCSATSRTVQVQLSQRAANCPKNARGDCRFNAAKRALSGDREKGGRSAAAENSR